MGARLVRQIAAIAALLLLASGASAQETETECQTIGGVLKCKSTTKQPYNDADAIQSGMNLVRPYVPTPRPQEPSPPPEPAPRAQSKQIATGNDLMAVCESKDPACLTYIQGVLDGFTVATEINDLGPRVCLPEGVTRGQTLDVILAEMKRSPENRHWPAAAVVMYALVKAFPCTK